MCYQLAIPWDQMDEEYLREPKVWSATSLVQFMFWLGPTSSVFDVITFLFAYYVYGFNTAEVSDAHPQDEINFNSLWFLQKSDDANPHCAHDPYQENAILPVPSALDRHLHHYLLCGYCHPL